MPANFSDLNAQVTALADAVTSLTAVIGDAVTFLGTLPAAFQAALLADNNVDNASIASIMTALSPVLGQINAQKDALAASLAAATTPPTP